MRGWLRRDVYTACSGGVVYCCFWQGLANRSMRIQDLYVGAFPRFIRNIPIRVCVNAPGMREYSLLVLVSLPGITGGLGT